MLPTLLRSAAPCRRGSQDGRELPGAVHWREGLRLQGVVLPPRHPGIHVPGRRLHQPQWNRREVHLRQQVRRRELQPDAHRAGHPVHGQRRAQHQWLAVLHLHREDHLAGRETRGVRQRGGGNGRRQEDGVLRILFRENQGQAHHRRLRPALSAMATTPYPNTPPAHPVVWPPLGSAPSINQHSYRWRFSRFRPVCVQSTDNVAASVTLPF